MLHTSIRMTNTNVMTRPVCPGLLQPITEADLEASALLYNSLPRIHSGMRVETAHVTKLLELINKHEMQGLLGLHLLHKHDDIANGTIRLESDLGVMSGSWSKAAPIDSIHLRSIHPVAFRYMPQENRLAPFEFAEGPSSTMFSDQHHEFFTEFSRYLDKHHLSNDLALEIAPFGADGHRQECTAEVEVENNGTVVLPKSMVNSTSFLPTGWFDLVLSEDSDTPPAGQTWAKLVNTSHKVFTNKQFGTPDEIVAELLKAGIIKL
ncbi:hypothetical protein CTA2_9689 [Colletotrichum tanaceti]|uniref:Uncharacterized protein n=1 Tax=Colletotrichum tanaceti TaxID=1306861 RepID=A0A4U6X7U6_9PEZI|nr:hypothetical protein CTA2_9689 [Colletotrichum tanaceti]TKW51581.1 hypothetical protein CTA1_10122 [Colletotrichum tanaceti]